MPMPFYACTQVTFVQFKPLNWCWMWRHSFFVFHLASHSIDCIAFHFNQSIISWWQISRRMAQSNYFLTIWYLTMDWAHHWQIQFNSHTQKKTHITISILCNEYTTNNNCIYKLLKRLVMRLLQRLFTSKRLILLTVELNGERTNEKDEHTHTKKK